MTVGTPRGRKANPVSSLALQSINTTPAPQRKLSQRMDYETMLAASQSLGSDAIDTLALLMRTSKHDSIRAACANAILDRGYGKPFQSVSVTTTETTTQPTKLDTVPIQDLDAMRRAMRQAMAMTVESTVDQGMTDVTHLGLDGKAIPKGSKE